MDSLACAHHARYIKRHNMHSVRGLKLERLANWERDDEKMHDKINRESSALPECDVFSQLDAHNSLAFLQVSVRVSLQMISSSLRGLGVQSYGVYINTVCIIDYGDEEKKKQQQ